MYHYLGLDISTSCTGYTILDKDGIVLENDCWKFDSNDSFFKKSEIAKDEIMKLQVKYNIKKVYIEESLQMFKNKFSSAHVISLLTKFNAVLSWFCYERFNLEPEYISASTARKTCGIKILKNGRTAKEQIMEYMLANEQWFKPQFKKTGKPKDFEYDKADSWITARAGYLTNP